MGKLYKEVESQHCPGKAIKNCNVPLQDFFFTIGLFMA
jgi:hypothetical protein